MYVQYVCACAFIQFAQTLHFFNSVKLHQASAAAILQNCLSVALNFERKQMVRKLCWKRFQKIRKMLNFWNARHSNENSWNFGRKIKWTEIEISNYPRDCPLFPKIWIMLYYSSLGTKIGNSNQNFSSNTCRKSLLASDRKHNEDYKPWQFYHHFHWQQYLWSWRQSI